MDKIFETPRLIVRPITMQDAPDIFEYAKDADTGPRAGWQPHKDIEITNKLVETWIEDYQIKDKANIYAIVWKDVNKVIGTIGLADLQHRDTDSIKEQIYAPYTNGKTTYEIGITIGKAYWSKGIATEALRAMINYLFNNKNADAIIVRHFQANCGSSRVQDKVGLQIIGQYQDDHPWYNSDNATHIVRLMTKEAWRAKQFEV